MFFISFPAGIIRILFLVSLTEAIGEKATPVCRLHQDFLQRMSRHRHGKIKFTDNGLPFSVVTIIAVSDQYKAVKSGVKLKTGSGGVFQSRLENPAGGCFAQEHDEQGHNRPNKVTDGPFVFRTKTGKLGMLWTIWIYDVYTQGVAYSKSGTLNGSWVQESAPITPPNFGHGMLFRTFEVRLLMVIHSHSKVNGRTIRIPHLFPVDDSGDKIIVGHSF